MYAQNINDGGHTELRRQALREIEEWSDFYVENTSEEEAFEEE